MTRFLAALATAMLIIPSASGAEASLQIEIAAGSDFERRVTPYTCSDETMFSVTYINAAPNFLAIVPIAEEPEPLIFAAVISASGVRYAAGQWTWWSQGVDASLYDATLGDDADPVLTCTEINNTP